MISSPITTSNGSSSNISKGKKTSKKSKNKGLDSRSKASTSSSQPQKTSSSSSPASPSSSSVNGHTMPHSTAAISIPFNNNNNNNKMASTHNHNNNNGNSSSNNVDINGSNGYHHHQHHDHNGYYHHHQQHHHTSSHSSQYNSHHRFADGTESGSVLHYSDIVAESPSDSVLSVFLDYAQEGHDSGLLSSINSLRRQGQFCDIRLVVDEHELPAHRAVLAACSPYLFDFLSCMEESLETQPIYKVPKEVSYAGFQYLLEYMYTGRLSVPLNDVPVVYGTAMVLKMEAAIRACADFLSQHLTASNCLGIRRFSRDNEFRSSVDDFIRHHMEDIMSSKSFFGLTDLQVEVVGLDENISDETMERRLFSLVLDWAKNNLNDLKPKLDRLTEQVNVLYLNHDNTLLDCADVEDTVLSSDDDMIIDYKKMARRRSKNKPHNGRSASSEGPLAFHKFSLNPEEALSVAAREWSIIATHNPSENAYLAIAVLDGQLMAVSVHVRPVQNNSGTADSNGTNSAPDSPTSASNGHSGAATAVMNFLDTSPIPRKASIAPLEWMNNPRCAMGAVVLGGDLIVCGGYDRGECLNSVEAFDLRENKWHELPPMNGTRGRFGAAVLDGCVYTCGGSDGCRELSCVEKFEPSTQKWTLVASMIKERSSHGVATLDGKLYCVGGCEGQRSISSCEVYDPASNQWSSIAPLNVARSQTCLCAFNGKLLAIGGTDLWNTLNTVEVYDPEENVWTVTSNLNIARRGAAVDVVNGTVVVAGGSDGTQSLTSSEIFDDDANSWTLGPAMITARANLSIVTMGTRLFAVGGFSGKRFLSSLEWLDMEGMEWLAHAPRLIGQEEATQQDEEEVDVSAEEIGSICYQEKKSSTEGQEEEGSL